MPPSIAKCFLDNVRRHPKKIAVIFQNNSLDYEHMAQLTGSFFSLLKSSGINSGDRVILPAYNNPHFIAAYIATHLMGGICVPVDPDISTNSFKFILSVVEPKVVFFEKEINKDGYIVHRFEDSMLFDNPGMESLFNSSEELTDKAADILFTSGTTGKPKGVVLNHKCIVATAKHINKVIGTSSYDREILPLPLSHSFGLGRMRCLLLLGATIILEDGFSNPKAIINSIKQYDATGLSSVPAGILILLRFYSNVFASVSQGLKYIEIGSAPMPVEEKHRLIKLLQNTHIYMHYGLTEASRSTFISFRKDIQKLDSVGLPSPNVDIRIVDSDGNICKRNNKGRIEVKGPHLFDRYWRDPVKTSNSIKESWLKTGDIGSIDEDGYLYLHSRESELINIAGRKVAPQEIERIIEMHPAIFACGCVGIPDPDGITGEIIVAFLVLNNSSNTKPKVSEIAKLVRENLEQYKIPSKILWIDNLPKTDSGKIQRHLLAQKIIKQ